MANERLRAAIHHAGLEVEDLADRVEVDVKTARRWVSGRTPRGRYRTAVAAALGTSERALWPELDLPGPGGGDQRGEIIAAYAHANDPAAPDWRTLLSTARETVDLLDLTLAEPLGTSGVIDLLAARARDGCQIRLLLSHPDSIHLAVHDDEQGAEITLAGVPDSAREVERSIGRLQPILPLELVEARLFVAARPGTVLRFDEQMLLTLPAHAIAPARAPLLHLRRSAEHGLFAQCAAHLDAIWDGAEPLDPDTGPDPSTHPDRDRRAPSLDQTI